MIEAVPNISEGRDEKTISSIAAEIQSIPGVLLLNVSSDVDHNRSVFTYASEDPDALFRATLALYEVAVPAINLQTHHGQHPRVGAVDVVPFVPLRGSEMSECVELARRVGAEVAKRFDIPVYLYEHAASSKERIELPQIRSGGFEKFGEKIARNGWEPDFGPRSVHPTAGVSVIGARVPLIAFNVQLSTDRLEVAQKVARAVRGISGGLRYVRALPIELKTRGIVQVSMNLLDYRKTPIQRAFALVRSEAQRHGVEVLSSEIVGLVPADALHQVAEWYLQLAGFHPQVVLEQRIAAIREAGDVPRVGVP
ncbi:MAG TPA: glutamate formimidoyltransferase [Thermoanaerobaculia bacterium]|nr:glutamate formimidoyltransferase [Thermoanaerobaculia bacterium]